MGTLTLGDELWAWVSKYPDGSIGMVASGALGIGITPLIGRSEKHIRSLEPIAAAHGRTTGQRVWLRRYVIAMDYPDV